MPLAVAGGSVRDAQPPTCLGERLFKPLCDGCARTGDGRPYYTEATVGLFAGLDLDLWGVHRSAVAAAIGAHNAALAEPQRSSYR